MIIESEDFHPISLQPEGLQGENIFLSETPVLSLNILVKSKMNGGIVELEFNLKSAYIVFFHAYLSLTLSPEDAIPFARGTRLRTANAHHCKGARSRPHPRTTPTTFTNNNSWSKRSHSKLHVDPNRLRKHGRCAAADLRLRGVASPT